MDDPFFARCVAAELLRTRGRPVVGRLPLILAVGAISMGVLLGASGVSAHRFDQLGDVVGDTAKALVVLSFVLASAIANDLLASGMTTTDRSLVGRPSQTLVAQSVANGLWCGVLCSVVSASVAGSVVLGALFDDGLSGPSSLWATGVAVIRAAMGSWVAGVLGVTVVRAFRSALVPIVGFLCMLLVGDPLLVTWIPQTAPLLVADNLVGLGTARSEGLTAAAVNPPTGAVITLAVVVIVVAITAVAEQHRDAPSPS